MVLAALLVLVACALAPAAHAHTDLRAASPGAGDLVPLPPESVVLVFASELDAPATQVVVRAPDGAPVQGRATARADTVTVPVLGTDAGRYEVVYRVMSLDGHPVVGSYSFDVEQAGTVRSGDPAAASTAPTGPGRTGGLVWWVVAAVAVSLALRAVPRRSRRRA